MLFATRYLIAIGLVRKSRTALTAAIKTDRAAACSPGGSGHFAGGGVSRNIPFQNPACPLLADDHSVTCDDLAPGDRHHRPSGNLEPLPGSVIGAMMQVLLPDRHAAMRIPQSDVGVEADADRPLSRA